MSECSLASFGCLGSGNNCPGLSEFHRLVVVSARQSRSSLDGGSNLPCTYRPIAKRTGSIPGVCRRDGQSLERSCLGGNTPAIEARERGSQCWHRFYQ